MEQYLITIKDKRKNIFLEELLTELDFIEVKKRRKSKKSEMVKDFLAALNDIALHEKGMKKLKTA